MPQYRAREKSQLNHGTEDAERLAGKTESLRRDAREDREEQHLHVQSRRTGEHRGEHIAHRVVQRRSESENTMSGMAHSYRNEKLIRLVWAMANTAMSPATTPPAI